MDFSKNRVLTKEQASIYTGYTESYLQKLCAAGIIPHSKPNGKTVFFDREALEAWMLSKPAKMQNERTTAAATYVSTH